MSVSVDIYDKIERAVLSNQNIKGFGLWNNQPMKSKEGSTNPVRYPFVGVQFENNYSLLSSGYNMIDGIFNLYLCIESLQHKDRDVLQLKDSLTQSVIYYLNANGFADVWKSFEIQDVDHDKGLLVHTLEFQYGYVDNTTKDNNLAVTGWTFTNNVTFS